MGILISTLNLLYGANVGNKTMNGVKNIGKSIPNMLVIEVSYLGATNTRGSRVKLHAPRIEEKVFLPFDYQYNDIESIALAYLESIGHQIIGRGEFKEKAILLSAPVNNQFQSIKQTKKLFYVLIDYNNDVEIDGIRYETMEEAEEAKKEYLARKSASGEIHNNLIIITRKEQ